MTMYHQNITLTWGGQPTPFAVGARVRTRGDIGSIGGFKVENVWNDWYCSCSDQSGKRYHFNMAFLEPDVPNFELPI